jgi:hypothetical protein
MMVNLNSVFAAAHGAAGRTLATVIWSTPSRPAKTPTTGARHASP